MKFATLSLGFIIILLALALKLFTYEYYFEDDPTTGIALRWQPTLENWLVFDDVTSVSIIQDENSFIGEGLYRIMVSWGWVLFLVIGTALIITSMRKRTRSAHSHTNRT
jgi:hypothetical protein